MAHQLPPEGDWRSWVVLGGRGAGKTRAGAEWVRAKVEGSRPLDPGACTRVALMGETIEQVREVMIFGDSGIMACSPPDRRPEYQATRKRLVWPNGAVATIHSAHDPESLRGPQFDAAWVDELAKWKKGEQAWDQLQFALRLGRHPQVCVTTTPRNVAVLKRLLERSSTVKTHAPTEANAAHLAASFLEEVRSRYAGTRLGRQELDGELLFDTEGALWSSALLEDCRISRLPEFDRIVVGLDPSASGGKGADECGIVVVGAQTQGPPQDWRAVVLADCTVQGASPGGWARAAIDAMTQYGADRIVAEVNQGGQMVTEVLRGVDPLVPVKAVHASRGKVARAEPVSALYEQGRVRHVAGLDALEDQMCQMTEQGFEGSGSPDRVDALVWALHALIVEPAAKWRSPGMRSL
ncbi:MAG: terminase family protein [Pseudomonadota bacterium]